MFFNILPVNNSQNVIILYDLKLEPCKQSQLGKYRCYVQPFFALLPIFGQRRSPPGLGKCHGYRFSPPHLYTVQNLTNRKR